MLSKFDLDLLEYREGSWGMHIPLYERDPKHWEISHLPSGRLFAPLLLRRAPWELAREFLNILAVTELGDRCDYDMGVYGAMQPDTLVLYREVEAACESLL